MTAKLKVVNEPTNGGEFVIDKFGDLLAGLEHVEEKSQGVMELSVEMRDDGRLHISTVFNTVAGVQKKSEFFISQDGSYIVASAEEQPDQIISLDNKDPNHVSHDEAVRTLIAGTARSAADARRGFALAKKDVTDIQSAVSALIAEAKRVEKAPPKQKPKNPITLPGIHKN